MINRKSKIAIGASGLAFLGIFIISYNYAINKINNEKPKKDTQVYIGDEKALKDELVIALYENNEEVKTLTVEMFKEDYGIEKTLTEDNLKSVLKDEGYKIDQKTDEIFTFKKEVKEKVEKNRYYIGENDGYFAIFHSDEKGNMSIVEEYDTMVDNIPLSDKKREDIKNKNVFSSEDLEEVRSEILEFTS